MRKELVAAAAEPIILGLLAHRESYGYAILQDVRRHSEDEMNWTDGMLYPVLHRLEDNGWIESRWETAENGRKRKYYSLTKAGSKALEAQEREWRSVDSVLASIRAAGGKA